MAEEEVVEEFLGRVSRLAEVSIADVTPMQVVGIAEQMGAVPSRTQFLNHIQSFGGDITQTGIPGLDNLLGRLAGAEIADTSDERVGGDEFHLIVGDEIAGCDPLTHGRRAIRCGRHEECLHAYAVTDARLLHALGIEIDRTQPRSNKMSVITITSYQAGNELQG